jgi:hypothetical protein
MERLVLRRAAPVEMSEAVERIVKGVPRWPSIPIS